MPPDPKDMARLWDMLDAAKSATEFIHELHYEDFLRDRKTRNAVERNLEILGEAARRVSPDLRQSLPQIPWKSIIGLRNVLAHEYGEIRHEVLWIVVREKLGPLIQEIIDLGADNPPGDAAN